MDPSVIRFRVKEKKKRIYISKKGKEVERGSQRILRKGRAEGKTVWGKRKESCNWGRAILRVIRERKGAEGVERKGIREEGEEARQNKAQI